MQVRRVERSRGWMWSVLALLSVMACSEDKVTGPKEEPPIDMAQEVEGTDDLSRASVCDSIKVPTGNMAILTLFARGDQVYRWDGTAWVFVEPVAKLYFTRFSHFVVGTHYTGPTWESRHGSKVMGAVVRRCPVDQKSIPWLLLSGGNNSDRGLFSKVNFIQRLNTVGGVAPSTPGTTVGEVRKVPYTADYRFYRAK